MNVKVWYHAKGDVHWHEFAKVKYFTLSGFHHGDLSFIQALKTMLNGGRLFRFEVI